MTAVHDTTVQEKSLRLIRLADGTLIDPTTREPISSALQGRKKDEQDDGRESVSTDQQDSDGDNQADDVGIDVSNVRATARRSLVDFGLSAPQMAVVNNVLVYTLCGLPDDEVAMQSNCTVHQLHIIRELDDYKRVYGWLVDALQAAYAGTVQGIISNAAPAAAKRVAHHVKSKSADVSIAASKDILDRAGFRPVDRVEHNHKFGNADELTIRIIVDESKANLPTLDLKPNA